MNFLVILVVFQERTQIGLDAADVGHCACAGFDVGQKCVEIRLFCHNTPLCLFIDAALNPFSVLGEVDRRYSPDVLQAPQEIQKQENKRFILLAKANRRGLRFIILTHEGIVVDDESIVRNGTYKVQAVLMSPLQNILRNIVCDWRSPGTPRSQNTGQNFICPVLLPRKAAAL